MTTLESGALRTGGVARIVGCSVQQVRNLERDGVLPPAMRTESGYRVYRQIHVRCALAYTHLTAGVGPVDAKRIVRTVHGSPRAALMLLDAAHARLHREREDLALAKEAAAAISAEQLDDAQPDDAMTVSELAEAIGVRASTLRYWDAEGLVVPGRASPRRNRRYSPAQVRDARIVHQLRRAGYRVPALRVVMRNLPRHRRADDVEAALAARDASLDARSRALLDAAAELSAVIGDCRAPQFSGQARPK